MGCCQTRDEDKLGFGNKKKKESKSLSLEIVDSEISVPSRASTDRFDRSLDAQQMLVYAETCYYQQKWEMLAPLLTVTIEVNNASVSLNWAEKPKSVGSVILIYLGLAVQKFTVQVSPYIEVFLPVILVFLKSGSTDKKELSLYLLHSYIDFASEKGQKKLLNAEIFGLIVKNMVSIKGELRKYSASLCYKLYKNKSDAKEMFIKADGVFYLMQLIGWNSSSDNLEELIKYLEEVVMDSAKYLIIDNLNATNQLKTLDILEKIDLKPRSFELKGSVERLIRFYRTFSETNLRNSV